MRGLRLLSTLTLPPPPPTIQARRVVVTGLGLITPLGATVESSWNSLIGGKIGTRRLEDAAYDKLPCRVAANVIRGGEGGFVAKEQIPQGVDISRLPECMVFALAAAAQAFNDAQWKPVSEEDKIRSGVSLGTGVGYMEGFVETAGHLSSGAARKISPHFIPNSLLNMLSGYVSLAYQLKGPVHCFVTACATGAHCVGDAYRLIKFGQADTMLAGGAEACVNPISIAGFGRMRALATSFNDSPPLASRPFDAQRDGFVMGEGAGVLLLEELTHAKARGAKIYAEVRGFGSTGDAYHVSASSEDGNAAIRAMEAALLESHLPKSAISHINAHATSTPKGDASEANAMATVFGEQLQHMSVTSNKGAIGHLLGAAGAVESIFSILSLYNNIAPLTANCENPDVNDAVARAIVRGENRKQEMQAVMSNSFGFGGTNASLIFAKYHD